MKIKFFINKKQAELCVGKINIFYGYNSSYKTYFANTILKGFEKNNSTILQINGIDASKMDYEVFS